LSRRKKIEVKGWCPNCGWNGEPEEAHFKTETTDVFTKEGKNIPLEVIFMVCPECNTRLTDKTPTIKGMETVKRLKAAEAKEVIEKLKEVK